MAEGRSARMDVVLIILILGVLVGGFWMTGQAVEEKTEVLATKIGVVESSQKLALERLSDLQNKVGALQASCQANAPAKAQPAAAPAPAPAAEPAKAAAPAKPAPAPKAVHRANDVAE